jgi:hypothetical protein
VKKIGQKIEKGESWVDASFSDRLKSINRLFIKKAQIFVEENPSLSFKKVSVCSAWLWDECIFGSNCFYSHYLPETSQNPLIGPNMM